MKTEKPMPAKKPRAKAPPQKNPLKKGKPVSKSNPLLDQKLADKICERLIVLGSLRKVCDTDPTMPSKSVIYHWLLKAGREGVDPIYDIFLEQYTRARQISKDYKFDEHWEELEEASKVPLLIDGVPVTKDGEIVMTVTPQSVQMARLKHDAFKWQASKENPKKYGDRVDLNHSGSVSLESLIAGAGDEPGSN